MKVTTKNYLTKLTGLILALFVSMPGLASANEKHDHGPGRKAVKGNFDWSVVPPAFTPQFLFNGTDGDVHVRHMPLVGKFSLAGRGIALDAKISIDFNAELDSTFSGVIWAPVTITARIDGVKQIIFEGQGTADAVGLVSAGVIKLEGRGRFEGTRLEFDFQEIGPGNTDTYSFKGVLFSR